VGNSIDSIEEDHVEAVGASKPRRSKRRFFIEWAIVVALAVIISLLIRAFAFQTFYIPSASMEPTLWPGDRIVVNKLSVEFGTINIGDIIVFKAAADVSSICHDPVKDLVKRVIGLPGDHLTSVGNTIFVNGKRLDQKWSHYAILVTPIKSVTVKANHYFVMGDYHSNSCDSRMWGTVPKSSIIGKAFVKFWPLKSFQWY
jgi:signal peptidase I